MNVKVSQCTVEDKKTFPFDVLHNGTVCIVVRCVLQNGIKTLQKRYALKTVVERLKKRLWNGCTTVVEQFTRALRSWVWLHALVELAERSRCKYKITGTIVRTPGSGRPSKITAEVKALVERQMRHDDGTTAAQFHVLLVRSGFAMEQYYGAEHIWAGLFRSSYCQLIRHENKQKRLGRGYIANSLERCPESHGLCPSRLPVAKMTTVFSDSNSSLTVFLLFCDRSATVPLPVCSLSWPFLCRFQTALLPYSYRLKTVQLRFLSVERQRYAAQ